MSASTWLNLHIIFDEYTVFRINRDEEEKRDSKFVENIVKWSSVFFFKNVPVSIRDSKVETGIALSCLYLHSKFL